MNVEHELTAEQVVALKKVVSDNEYKLASGGLNVGDAQVDFNVNVSGRVRKAEDEFKPSAPAAQPWLLLAVALSKLNGVTVESLTKEAVAGELDVASIKKDAAEAIKTVVGTTSRKFNGKVTTKLDVKVV